jgi:lysophospholipase L1-like esterase
MVRYVALGDSYTIGTGISHREAWPSQLADNLTDLEVELVANLAVNGFTADDVAAEQLPELAELEPDLVSLLVGVNDVVRGVPEERYGARVSEILDGLLERLPATRIFVVAVPDYTVSRQGDAYAVPAQQRAAILRNNEIMRGACEYRSITFVPDIFDISHELGDGAGMLAPDGLHPSAAQHARWAAAIEPAVRAMLALPSPDR